MTKSLSTPNMLTAEVIVPEQKSPAPVDLSILTAIIAEEDEIEDIEYDKSAGASPQNFTNKTEPVVPDLSSIIEYWS